MTQDRVIDFEGIHNFRDYGGYAVAGGGRLKRGLLWRSGQHHGASDADLARIGALGLAAVYDLRSHHERTTHPCRRPTGFAGRVVTTDADTRGVAHQLAAPHLQAGATARRRDAASARESMRRSYENIAFRPSLLAMMRTYIADHADLAGGSLVNCMAGKDRTGFAVAMLQTALGVHADDVMADYLLTNTAGDIEARVAAGGEAIRSSIGDLEPDVLKALMGVEPEYLFTAFAAVTERFGSIETYLEQELGASEDLRERLRVRLVE
ncbi:MAG: tyrosine-protein phosphatase [Sphingomonadales bacterium]|nr:tyrosine-protein phosphatase [Sphingomonadales bacterium]